MTLRSRLVAGLVALSAVALVAFAFVTTQAYDRSQRQDFDRQLDAAVPHVARELFEAAGLSDTRPRPPQDEAEGPLQIPAGYAARLYSTEGEVLGEVTTTADASPDFDDVEEEFLVATDTPDTPDTPVAPQRGSKFVTVGSESGGASWRVVVPAAFGPTQLVLAAPLSDVESGTRRLVVIEGIGVALMLLALGAGSWLIVRRGLRPLESMANQARTLHAGELDRRVQPADARSEVGELGLAINSMLDRIQTAFDERAATEAKLRQFLADASHELRTPLTSIRGFAEVAGHTQAEPAHVQHALKRIEDESARMGRLIEELLLLARLDQRRPLESSALDLVVLADEVCTNAAAAHPGRSITLDAAGPTRVMGDADLLRQALSNLVSNALRHTPASASVTVEVRAIGHLVEVVVSDTGPGLAPESLARVFDRFWQADPSRAAGGSGLGLAIVAAIVAEHGGTVLAANRPADVGGGARFTLRIPVDARGSASSASPASPSSSGGPASPGSSGGSGGSGVASDSDLGAFSAGSEVSLSRRRDAGSYDDPSRSFD